MTDERIGIDAKIAEIGIQQHRSGIMLCIVMMFGVVVAWIVLAAATSSSVEFRKRSTEKGFDVNSPIRFS
jgi:Tfp pilus assembly protein PilX